jgi:hypothetical protein
MHREDGRHRDAAYGGKTPCTIRPPPGQCGAPRRKQGFSADAGGCTRNTRMGLSQACSFTAGSARSDLASSSAASGPSRIRGFRVHPPASAPNPCLLRGAAHSAAPGAGHAAQARTPCTKRTMADAFRCADRLDRIVTRATATEPHAPIRSPPTHRPCRRRRGGRAPRCSPGPMPPQAGCTAPRANRCNHRTTRCTVTHIIPGPGINPRRASGWREQCGMRRSKQEIWNHRCTPMHTDGPESGRLVHGNHRPTGPDEQCRCGVYCPIRVHPCASVVEFAGLLRRAPHPAAGPSRRHAPASTMRQEQLPDRRCPPRLARSVMTR